MNTPAFSIAIACYAFKCPACGARVTPGESYLVINNTNTCLCQLPAPAPRRLRPLLTTTKN